MLKKRQGLNKKKGRRKGYSKKEKNKENREWKRWKRKENITEETRKLPEKKTKEEKLVTVLKGKVVIVLEGKFVTV